MLKKICINVVDVEQSLKLVSSALEAEVVDVSRAACACRVLADRLTEVGDQIAVIADGRFHPSANPSSSSVPKSETSG